MKNTLKMSKNAMVKALEKGPCSVTFVKKDGSERVMVCTREENAFPEHILGIGKPTPPHLVCVLDLEAGSLKSFCVDRVVEFEELA